jgi:molecular chaperone HtpG
MLAEFAEKKDDYNKFFEQFGKSLKLGIHVDSTTDGSMALVLAPLVLVQGQLAP